MTTSSWCGVIDAAIKDKSGAAWRRLCRVFAGALANDRALVLRWTQACEAIRLAAAPAHGAAGDRLRAWCRGEAPDVDAGWFTVSHESVVWSTINRAEAAAVAVDDPRRVLAAAIPLLDQL